MAFDKNKDGKLTKDEITDPRLLGLFQRADADKDGIVTTAELEALFQRETAIFGSGGGKGGFGPGDKGPKGKGFKDKKGKKGPPPDFDGPPDFKKGPPPKDKGPKGPPPDGDEARNRSDLRTLSRLALSVWQASVEAVGQVS